MNRVSADVTDAVYNSEPPYHPDTSFPELAFSEVSQHINPAYALFRKLLLSLAYDTEHYGTPDWNPLGHLVSPGQTVLLKPNFVLDHNASGDNVFAVITHPSILRVVIDYVYIALRGKGRIIIADAPQMDCSWDKLTAHLHVDTIQRFYQERFGFPIDMYDLRNFELIDASLPAYVSNRRLLAGDPAGSVVINLGRKSAFHGLPSENYYGADYNRRETIAHHHGNVHEYTISKTVLAADVFISVPKMKVHKKVGVTLNLKGLVGINTNKNCLIHYRLGTPRTGGDQLPDQTSATDGGLIRGQRMLYDLLLAKQNRWTDAIYKGIRSLYRICVKPFHPISENTRTLDAGNWYGNDSAWRMTSDLAKILFFADRNGILCDKPQRRIFCLVDGIIAGEKEGPLAPTARPAGCLIAGENPFAVDIATTRLMGFDPRKIKSFDIMLSNDWNFGLRSFQSLELFISGQSVRPDVFFSRDWKCPLQPFSPHSGWVGHLEITS